MFPPQNTSLKILNYQVLNIYRTLYSNVLLLLRGHIPTT